MKNKTTGTPKKNMGRPIGSKNKTKKRKYVKSGKFAKKAPAKRADTTQHREPLRGEAMDRNIENPLFSVLDGPPPLARYTLSAAQQKQLTQLGEVLAKADANTKNVALHDVKLRGKVITYLHTRYPKMAFKSSVTRDKKDIIIWRTK